MTDIALAWNADDFAADLMLDAGQLATDDGMRTAILISLFSDARAAPEAVLPEEGDDRRGWWGDAVATDAGPDAGSARDRNRIGSLLWLLARSKATARVLIEAKQHCEEALDWLVRDGVASAVRVYVEAQGQTLAIAVELDRPTGPSRERHDFTWDASASELRVEALA